MQWRRQVVDDHLGRFQMRECRMHLLETVNVVEDRLDDLINRIRIRLGRRNKRRTDTKGRHIVVCPLVHTARYSGDGIIGVVRDKASGYRIVYRHDDRITGCCRFLDRAVRMTSREDHGINFVITQCR